MKKSSSIIVIRSSNCYIQRQCNITAFFSGNDIVNMTNIYKRRILFSSRTIGENKLSISDHPCYFPVSLSTDSFCTLEKHSAAMSGGGIHREIFGSHVRGWNSWSNIQQPCPGVEFMEKYSAAMSGVGIHGVYTVVMSVVGNGIHGEMLKYSAAMTGVGIHGEIFGSHARVWNSWSNIRQPCPGGGNNVTTFGSNFQGWN
jgi:hypothetical protein